MFLAPRELEYLQRLGALHILEGSVNEGRHYLSRAVSLYNESLQEKGLPMDLHIHMNTHSTVERTTPYVYANDCGCASSGAFQLLQHTRHTNIYTWIIEYVQAGVASGSPNCQLPLLFVTRV